MDFNNENEQNQNNQDDDFIGIPDRDSVEEILRVSRELDAEVEHSQQQKKRAVEQAISDQLSIFLSSRTQGASSSSTVPATQSIWIPVLVQVDELRPENEPIVKMEEDEHLVFPAPSATTDPIADQLGAFFSSRGQREKKGAPTSSQDPIENALTSFLQLQFQAASSNKRPRLFFDTMASRSDLMDTDTYERLKNEYEETNANVEETRSQLQDLQIRLKRRYDDISSDVELKRKQLQDIEQQLSDAQNASEGMMSTDIPEKSAEPIEDDQEGLRRFFFHGEVQECDGYLYLPPTSTTDDTMQKEPCAASKEPAEKKVDPLLNLGALVDMGSARTTPFPLNFREFSRTRPEDLRHAHLVGQEEPYSAAVLNARILEDTMQLGFTQETTVDSDAGNARMRSIYRFLNPDQVHTVFVECFARDIVRRLLGTFEEDRDMFNHIFTTEQILQTSPENAADPLRVRYAVFTRSWANGNTIFATVTWDLRDMSVELDCHLSHASDEANAGETWMPFLRSPENASLFARDTVWDRTPVAEFVDFDYPPRFYLWMMWEEMRLPPSTFPGGYQRNEPPFRTLFPDPA